MLDWITYRMFLFVFLTVLNSSTHQKQTPVSLALLSADSEYEAGSTIALKVLRKGSEQSWPLLISGSYGKVLVPAQVASDTLIYRLPPAISHKKGLVNWKLISQTQTLSGEFEIKSTGRAAMIETYLGPPSIVAGGRDFAMQISQPIDRLDNLLEDGAQVHMKYHFLDDAVNDSIQLKNSYAFRTIYSPKRTGRMVALSSMQRQHTAEFVLDVLPGLPSDFDLSYDRVHPYADGNQICTFKTSVIVDADNNKVADGTLVQFVVSNQLNEHLSTYGTTIDGIAEADLIHPEQESVWTLKAFVPGMAESNAIEINFEKAIADFPIHTVNHNQIVVGPIRSFMNQDIPDGFSVQLYLKSQQKFEQLDIGYTRKGYVYFELPGPLRTAKKTEFLIKAGDITKTYNIQNE